MTMKNLSWSILSYYTFSDLTMHAVSAWCVPIETISSYCIICTVQTSKKEDIEGEVGGLHVD